ncbi:hypothetical protein ACJQWK_01977 [Exserohilum turcicum]|uniref:Gfd2/YDR514C-like C-terminal domain-containing protein n=1 Tax=Exserohilum turcicum (strain 28A) TaxID=671987 RepID=R0IU67_EXST2|nr:uncharacterized protein SETTUDRAFT_160625 [Exserohilum turcica Et28A]EOA88141.1 hypothetical protein SETTUDRAFT_160625 [Exserohilum turcica Et28A]
MSLFGSRRLRQLRDDLCTLPGHTVLQDYLQDQIVFSLRRAVLVTLHRKWSENSPYRLTELGVTTFDRASSGQNQLLTPGPHAENILRQIWSFRLVIRSTAHLDASMHSSPFHFGTTLYASQEEALDLLHQIWHQPMSARNAKAGFRPIIYMSFGDNDALSKTRRSTFDFDPSSLNTTVATLNAQFIPQKCKITRHANASLTYLLSQFKVPTFHTENSGNAAMYATVVAVLSALRVELYQADNNAVAKPAQTSQSSSKSAEEVLQGLMDWPTPAPPFGLLVYCCRCGSTEHASGQCTSWYLSCKICEGALQHWRRENAGTHTEGMCSFGWELDC